MRSLKAPSGQTARWLESVTEYDLEVHHKAGRSLGNADTFSRNPCASCQHQKQLKETANEESIECTESNNTVIRVTTRTSQASVKTTKPCRLSGTILISSPPTHTHTPTGRIKMALRSYYVLDILFYCLRLSTLFKCSEALKTCKRL